MAYYLSEILLWLFIINVGTAFGAGLYEAKIVIPQWAAVPAGGGLQWNAEAARRTDPDQRFWAFLTTWPLPLLTAASVIAAWYSLSPRRELWLGAAVLVLVERFVTFVYFIPTMVKLQHETVLPSTVGTTVTRWISLNHVRTGIYLAAWVTALQALSFAR